MLRFYFNRRIVAGLVAALSILFVLAYLSNENKLRLVANSDSVAHTLDVLFHAERVLSHAINLELGQRGYTITGNDTFLLTYAAARRRWPEELNRLRQLTVDNDLQQSRVNDLQHTLRKLTEFSDSAVQTRKVSRENAIKLNSSLEGKGLLDGVRRIVAAFQAEEHRLLAIRSGRNEIGISRYNRTFILLLVATTLILLLIFYAINVNLRARIRTENRLKIALHEIEDLYDNAPCGYHSLDENGVFVNANSTLCNWLGYKRGELLGKVRFRDIISEADQALFEESFPKFKATGAIYDMEFTLIGKDKRELPVVLSAIAIKDKDGRYLKSRSISIDNTDRKSAEMEIKNLNQELEAFTYSVSHDLRAPLRSIDGYARILQEDYSQKLDAEGERVINVIMNNARRMGKLIDDLLEFARLGRKDLQRVNVDMTGLVNSIKKELLEEQKGRSIEVDVKSLHNAPVDIDMIRQVWINLLANALKYTGKVPHAHIEISSTKSDHSVEYIVKDNGVGFDMAYVSKLFGVFQRLHRPQDFSGTGVGLAIVRRVVEKHDGQVWATGAVNQGASFHFTIPTNNG